jgi:hypothetical protein
MAIGLVTRLVSSRPRRSVLVALISLALLLSFFHPCCLDGDVGAVTVAVAQGGHDSADDNAASPASDCCHCLAHAATLAPQANAVEIEYFTRSYSLAAATMPEAADLASPFEPPRA